MQLHTYLKHLLGADIAADRFKPMRSTYLSLTLESDGEADRVFGLLADGGEIFSGYRLAR